MENAERNTETNGKERRDTLPHIYGLRANQFFSQLRSKTTKLQATTQILRQNGLHAELFTFLFCGTLS